MKECTFQPTTTPYNFKRVVSTSRERLLQSKKRAPSSTPSPRPEGRPKSGGRPVFHLAENYQQLVENKQLRLSNLKEQQLSDPNLTFKPSINQTSLKIASSLGLPQDPSVRFRDYELLREEKRLALIEKEELRFQKKYPFRPDLVSKNTHELNEELALQDFELRQEEYRLQAEQRRRQREEAQLQSAFFPKIDPISRILAENRRENENVDHIEALYDLPLQRKREKQEQLIQEELERMPFTPQINPISRILARSKSSSNNPHADSRTRKLEQEAIERANKKLEECSFKPQINKNFANVQSNYKADRIEESLKLHKERALEKLHIKQKEAEFNEVKSCTFKPEIYEPLRREETSLQEVPGVSGFFRHIQRSHKLKKDKELREKEVFRDGSNYDPSKPLEVRPFNLRTEERKGKK